MKKLVLLVMLIFIAGCDTNNSPTSGNTHETGSIRVIIAGEDTTEKITPDAVNKGKQLAKPATVNSLVVQVLNYNNAVVHSLTFTPTDGFFEVYITVHAESNMKVLCIGKNNDIIERFGLDEDVDVEPGKDTSAEIIGWNSRYIPVLNSISPNPSPDGNFSVFWNQIDTASTYILEEADNPQFTGTKTVYSGANLQKDFTGKSGGTYYYRVKSSNKYNVTSGWSESESVEVQASLSDLGIHMLPIPEGSFDMGSDNGLSNEMPVHTVKLDAFSMSETEITQGQYKEIIGNNPSHFTGDDTLPVDNVKWTDAAKFCNELSDREGLDRCYSENTWECDFSANGFRLPTEAEWEYACRAGTSTQYYTGDTGSDLARAGWYDTTETKPVKQKNPNVWGLYDMHGNVEELCNDWYDSEYYSTSPADNPYGPEDGSYRVVRGGCAFKVASQCRSTYRDSYDWSLAYVTGFRVVRRENE
ncbi:MAG: formylglycine-generating enzyme family protein [Candidatus Latescibacteria bacterium]|nr:formylglycine-generating enzyme family protein [Candidatus Latescibacterota bacterium]